LEWVVVGERWNRGRGRGEGRRREQRQASESGLEFFLHEVDALAHAVLRQHGRVVDPRNRWWVHLRRRERRAVAGASGKEAREGRRGSRRRMRREEKRESDPLKPHNNHINLSLTQQPAGPTSAS